MKSDITLSTWDLMSDIPKIYPGNRLKGGVVKPRLEELVARNMSRTKEI